jgi:hypothetical protein
VSSKSVYLLNSSAIHRLAMAVTLARAHWLTRLQLVVRRRGSTRYNAVGAPYLIFCAVRQSSATALALSCQHLTRIDEV